MRAAVQLGGVVDSIRGEPMFWLIEKIADFCHWRAKRAEAQATAAIERARKWLQRERSITNGAIENGTEKES